MTSEDERLPAIVAQFETGDEVLAVEALGSGHIHDTWVARDTGGERRGRFVLQRLNRTAFTSPDALMENIDRVTSHLAAKIRDAGGDPTRETLTIIPTRDGRRFHQDEDGDCWRVYLYVDGAFAHDRPLGPAHVREAGRAFARFHRQVADLPGPRLHETIPGFGDTRGRFAEFQRAVRADAHARSADARAEIDFALEREPASRWMVELLESGAVPERIVHFDTKLNNVLIDERTGEAVCVIDLDTVMPGTILYDFGDAARRGVCRTDDDERDLSRIALDLELFEQLTAGFLEIHRGFLIPAEIDGLVEACRVLALTIGLRFLADHLSGDGYFRTAYTGHNLDRCRTQFTMVRRIEEHSSRMCEIVEKLRP